MAMREKLIEQLSQIDACICTLCGEEGALERVSGVIADHLIANGVTIQKWIPVTERLPESKTKVLVYGGNELIWENGVKRPMPSVYTGYMRGLDEGWFTWEEHKYIVNATHWMPLPEPPEG